MPEYTTVAEEVGHILKSRSLGSVVAVIMPWSP